MSFTVIEIDSSLEFLRGTLQRRLLEVRAGLFVGNIPARVRDEMWHAIGVSSGPNESAIMIYPSSKHECGFLIRTIGSNRREPIDSDGAWLMRYTKTPQVNESSMDKEIKS